ncbi:hypothetical protein ACFXDE_15735 [Kitasatospora sp. NPDC059408]|uniref:hypothetical protein n=1 Tax=Kitasatospora sp. NPDC059408 TaxID=3346823 RepID=UPI0036BD6278
MSEDPVNPAEVPVFTGDLFALDNRVRSISTGGAAIASAAGAVHTSFGGLKSYYKAPEAEQLFATTKPVDDLGTKLSSDACVIAGALGTYSRDAHPLVKRLADLKHEAESFHSKVAGDHDWRQDEGKVKENNRRRDEIAEVWTQFQGVERDAYAKIVALVGGKPLRVNDGSGADDMYGYNAKDLKESKSLPWGDAVDRDIPWWNLPAQAIEFGKGVFVDGVWGTIKGLGTLVGFDGWDAFKQSWTGLAKLATGLVITAVPFVGMAYWAMPEDKLPSWLRDSRNAMKETGKALVAWDEWKTNPSRAGGAVTFNVLTAMTGGGAAASGAGKAGFAGKALSIAGKVGKVIDPMTYVFKGVGFGISKAGDVMAALRGISEGKIPTINLDGAFVLPEDAVKLPDGTIRLPKGAAIPEGAIRTADGGIKLPKGTVELPPGTVKLEHGGKAEFMDPHGNVYDEAGNLRQHGDEAPMDGANPNPAKPKPPVPAHAKTPELVGVGGRAGAIKLGSDVSDPAHVPNHVPDDLLGKGHDLTPAGHTPGGHAPDGPRNDLNAPHGGRDDTSAAGGHDNPTTGGHDGGSTGGHDGGSTDGHNGHNSLSAAERAAQRAEYEAAREKPADERTPEEKAAIAREHVHLANENPAWREENYNKLGRRHRTRKLVDGQTLPQLTDRPGGGWMNADDLPLASSERFELEYLARGADTVHPDDIAHLDDVSAKRRAGMALTAAQKALDENKTASLTQELAQKLADAQEHFDNTVGVGVPNNSKLGEALGEEAARRHMLKQPEFRGAKEITDLPETANGSKRFDQLWRDSDGNLVIVECKGPRAELEWRRGNGPEDRMTKVKQGTLEYTRTISADMDERAIKELREATANMDDLSEGLRETLAGTDDPSDYVRAVLAEMDDRALAMPKDGQYAQEIRAAIKDGTLRYVLVQALENDGTYAGAELRYFKIR